MAVVEIPQGVEILRTPADVDRVLSGGEPVLLFKHSTRCGISMEALSQLTAYLESGDKPAQLKVALVRVIEERPLSMALAERLGVVHKSPQAILIRDGRAVWHASHYAITRESLHRAVEAHLGAGGA